MVLFNYSTKELTAKVVYYGPGLCGKTTNLQWIHEKIPIKNKGKMLSLATETDRTLFFDFLPIELGTIRGMRTRIQLYTVPGQVFYNATRRMVLKGADCVVFVCDSQEAMLEANLESLENLRENLEVNEINPNDIPTVLQYNKRDLPNALPLAVLQERLNPHGWPHYEAVAVKGQGVEQTLKGVTAVVFRTLASKYGSAEEAAATSTAAAAAAPVAARPAPAPPRAAPVAPAAFARSGGAQPAMPPAAAAEPADLFDDLGLEEALPSAIEVSEDELSFGMEAPAPLAPPPAPAPAPMDPKATVVRDGADVAALRQRIMRGGPPPAAATPAPQPVPDPGYDPLPLEPVPPPAPPPRAPAPAAAPVTVQAPAMRVEIPVSGAAPEIAIPLEIVVEGGQSARLNLHLRVKVDVKR